MDHVGEDGEVTPQDGDGDSWGDEDASALLGLELDDVGLTPLQEMAVEVHETYESYLFAGFSAKQAIWLSVIEGRSHVEPPGDDYFDLDD